MRSACGGSVSLWLSFVSVCVFLLFSLSLSLSFRLSVCLCVCLSVPVSLSLFLSFSVLMRPVSMAAPAKLSRHNGSHPASQQGKARQNGACVIMLVIWEKVGKLVSCRCCRACEVVP